PRIGDVLIGYGPLLLLAIIGFAFYRRKCPGPYLLALLLCAIWTWQRQGDYAANALWLDIGPWLGIFAAAIVVCLTYRADNPAIGLMFSWTLLGIVALYYPGL